MPKESGRPGRNRIVIETPAAGFQRMTPRDLRPAPGRPERVIALTVISAAALATFLALFVTSRTFNPMNSTVETQQVVPVGPLSTQTTPRQSPSPTASTKNQNAVPGESPEPGGVISQAPPDDAAIQADIEKALAADATLARLDVSTIVEAGRVTIVGSVRSTELKQRLEKVIRSVKGIVNVDNQLVVLDASP